MHILENKEKGGSRFSSQVKEGKLTAPAPAQNRIRKADFTNAKWDQQSSKWFFEKAGKNDRPLSTMIQRKRRHKLPILGMKRARNFRPYRQLKIQENIINNFMLTD